MGGFITRNHIGRKNNKYNNLISSREESLLLKELSQLSGLSNY